MRPTLLLVATAASCASVTGIGCPQHLFEELVTRTSCGDNKSVSSCLQSGIDLGRLDEIEQCYIAGGCSEADATVGAVWFAHDYRAEVQAEDGRQDLRRRADATDTTSDSAESTKKTTEKTSSAAKKTTESTAAASSSTAPSTAAASTTSESTTSASTTTSSTSSSTASSTTSSSTTTSSSSSASTGQVTTTGTLLCSTTKTVQTSACVVTSGTTASCVSTTTLVATCAAGNLCSTNSAGEDTCMKIDNTVGVPGIVIATVFGVSILAVTVGIIVMNVQAGNAAKRQKGQHEAFLADYKDNGRGRGTNEEAFGDGPQSRYEANIPLIQEPGKQGYGEQEVVDDGRRAPHLHQGLGSLA